MSRLTRDGTAEPVSRDQILRHARGQGNIYFPCSATTSRIGNLTRLIYTLLYVMTTHTYIHTVPLIAMQGYQTKTEDAISLDYNSICYITSRIGWVSMKGIFKYRCRRDPGKMPNSSCYTYLTKDQQPPSNLLVYSTIQYSTIEIMIRCKK